MHIQEGGSLIVKICPNARSPKVTRPPSKYLHERCKILIHVSSMSENLAGGQVTLGEQGPWVIDWVVDLL